MNDKILRIMEQVLETSPLDETVSQANCDKWDSLHHLNLVVELEEQLGVEFEPEEIAQMKTFGDIVRIVKTK